jgi:multidrug efflux system outer membrane protein
MMRKLTFLACIAVFMTGCPRAVKYQAPQLPVPETWTAGSGSQAGVAGAPAAANVKWQEFFADPRLRSVIDLALANNRDLRIASLNIEKVQNLYRIRRAELYPVVGVAASVDSSRIPENMASSGNAHSSQQYSVSFGTASWELDLFGRVRSLKEAALEQYLATEQARSATQISLVSAVAESYLALTADRENLKLALATLETQQASYDLIRSIRDLGMTSDLEVSQAQSQVDAAKVEIAIYSSQLPLDENALNLLVGSPVPADMLADNLGQIAAFKDISAGLSSDVLLGRPDILAAEHQLRAAHANINVARAAFFPRIALTAGVGLVSGDLTDLFKWGARTWAFAPQITFPIFDSGSRQAGLNIANVDRDIAVAEYERAIQSAFREVNDALSLQKTLVAQQDALQALLSTLEETYRLSEARYQGGIDSYLSVLVAQRSLYGAQQQLVGIRLARQSNLVTLYKVLGGGA